MGEAGETFEAGGSGSNSLRYILSRSSTSGDTLRGRDMDPRVFGGEDTQGVHSGSLRHVKVNRARWQWDGSCRREGADSVLQVAGTQPLQMFIDRRKATLAE